MGRHRLLGQTTFETTYFINFLKNTLSQIEKKKKKTCKVGVYRERRREKFSVDTDTDMDGLGPSPLDRTSGVGVPDGQIRVVSL